MIVSWKIPSSSNLQTSQQNSQNVPEIHAEFLRFFVKNERGEDYEAFVRIKMLKVKKYLNNYVRTSIIYSSKIVIVRFGKKNTFQSGKTWVCGYTFRDGLEKPIVLVTMYAYLLSNLCGGVLWYIVNSVVSVFGCVR